MNKRSLLTLIVGLFSINLVSAADFSLEDLLGGIDSSTMILGSIFIISFALLFFSLSKVFKDKYGEPNKQIAGVISFVVSLLITYGINKTGFDIEGFFFDMGISTDILMVVLPLIIIAGVIFLVWKFKKNSLFILGGLFILLRFTNWIYSKVTSFVIGAILIAIGLFLRFKKKGIGSRNYGDYGYETSSPGRLNPRQEYKQQLAERKYEEKMRQAGIKARAQNIENIKKERLKRDAEREKRRQQQQIQQEKQRQREERKQITSNLQSLIKSYNDLQRKNPNDPRLQELAKEIKRLKSQR